MFKIIFSGVNVKINFPSFCHHCYIKLNYSLCLLRLSHVGLTDGFEKKNRKMTLK